MIFWGIFFKILIFRLGNFLLKSVHPKLVGAPGMYLPIDTIPIDFGVEMWTASHLKGKLINDVSNSTAKREKIKQFACVCIGAL